MWLEGMQWVGKQGSHQEGRWEGKQGSHREGRWEGRLGPHLVGTETYWRCRLRWPSGTGDQGKGAVSPHSVRAVLLLHDK